MGPQEGDGESVMTFLDLVTQDPFANVYAFLPQKDQYALWQTCSALRHAFGRAVELEEYIGLAACYDPQGAALKDFLPRSFSFHASAGEEVEVIEHHQSEEEDEDEDSAGCWAPIHPRHLVGEGLLRDVTLFVSLGDRRGAGGWPCSRIIFSGKQPRAAYDIPRHWYSRSDSPALKQAVFLGCDRITTLDRSSLECCCSLTKVDFTGEMPNLTKIGSQFLFACSSLQALDLSHGFDKVREIGGQFLDGCSSLAEVNLSSLRNVIHIGKDFMRQCTALQHLDLSFMGQVTEVGSGFLLVNFGRSSLKRLQLSSSLGSLVITSSTGSSSNRFRPLQKSHPSVTVEVSGSE